MRLGGDVEPPLQHPVGASEIRLTITTTQPGRQLADDRLKLQALLDGDVPFIRRDRISRDVLGRRHHVATCDLHATYGSRNSVPGEPCYNNRHSKLEAGGGCAAEQPGLATLMLHPPATAFYSNG